MRKVNLSAIAIDTNLFNYEKQELFIERQYIKNFKLNLKMGMRKVIHIRISFLFFSTYEFILKALHAPGNMS